MEGKINKRIILGIEIFFWVLFVFLQFLNYNTNILMIIAIAAIVMTWKTPESKFQPKE